MFPREASFFIGLFLIQSIDHLKKTDVTNWQHPVYD